MENKKGQAAMEFILTYGWAILAAIIAIVVLAYFGDFEELKSNVTDDKAEEIKEITELFVFQTEYVLFLSEKYGFNNTYEIKEFTRYKLDKILEERFA